MGKSFWSGKIPLGKSLWFHASIFTPVFAFGRFLRCLIWRLLNGCAMRRNFPTSSGLFRVTSIRPTPSSNCLTHSIGITSWWYIQVSNSLSYRVIPYRVSKLGQIWKLVTHCCRFWLWRNWVQLHKRKGGRIQENLLGWANRHLQCTFQKGWLQGYY